MEKKIINFDLNLFLRGDCKVITESKGEISRLININSKENKLFPISGYLNSEKKYNWNQKGGL
jgi:hypothetical protein